MNQWFDLWRLNVNAALAGNHPHKPFPGVHGQAEQRWDQ
jgi:hypothetical protein